VVAPSHRLSRYRPGRDGRPGRHCSWGPEYNFLRGKPEQRIVSSHGWRNTSSSAWSFARHRNRANWKASCRNCCARTSIRCRTDHRGKGTAAAVRSCSSSACFPSVRSRGCCSWELGCRCDLSAQVQPECEQLAVAESRHETEASQGWFAAWTRLRTACGLPHRAAWARRAAGCSGLELLRRLWKAPDLGAALKAAVQACESGSSLQLRGYVAHRWLPVTSAGCESRPRVPETIAFAAAPDCG